MNEDWREDLPDSKSPEYMMRDASERFEAMFPDENLVVVDKDRFTERVLDRMWAGAGELTKMRKSVLAITETNAPKAYAYVKTVAGYGAGSRIQQNKYPDAVVSKLPNGTPVTFAQLKIGPMRPDGLRAWEYCVLFNVDDYEDVLDYLSQFKEKAQPPRTRRASVPTFQKVMSGGFWDKIKQVRLLPDGAVDYGSSALSNAEYRKFRNLRKEGVIKFGPDGKVLVDKEALETVIPSFVYYLSLFGS